MCLAGQGRLFKKSLSGAKPLPIYERRHGEKAA